MHAATPRLNILQFEKAIIHIINIILRNSGLIWRLNIFKTLVNRHSPSITFVVQTFATTYKDSNVCCNNKVFKNYLPILCHPAVIYTRSLSVRLLERELVSALATNAASFNVKSQSIKVRWSGNYKQKCLLYVFVWIFVNLCTITYGDWA